MPEVKDIEQMHLRDCNVSFSAMRDIDYWFSYQDEAILRVARFLSHYAHVPSMIYISWCYLNDRLVPRQFDKALRWAVEARKTSDPESSYYLGWVCLQGPDERFAQKSWHYLAEAAEMGHQKAIHDRDLLSQLNLNKPELLWQYRHRLPSGLDWIKYYALSEDFLRLRRSLVAI